MCGMRAVGGHANQVSRVESCFPRSYERGYGARHTLGRSKFGGGTGGFVRAGYRVRFGLHQNLHDVEVTSRTESKAMLEHRTTKRRVMRRTQTPQVVTRQVAQIADLFGSARVKLHPQLVSTC